MGKTLFIPDGVEIIGNGATIVIDDRIPADSQSGLAFEQLGTNSKFREFAIMTDGFGRENNQSSPTPTTSFSMDGLNFVMRDDYGAAEMPTALFGLKKVEDVQITNCSFSVYSEARVFILRSMPSANGTI